MRSLNEARTYLEKLRQILKYIDISDCIIEKGQFRCDVNISIRPKGSCEFGNRSEIKNMASFRFIMEALEYEVRRQAKLLEAGEQPLQETRLFDETKKVTLPMRSKEDAPDYRYFPDPDLIEVDINQDFLAEIKKRMPELPDQKVDRIMQDYDLSRSDVLILTRDRNISDYFENCAAFSDDPKRLCKWMIKDLFKLLNEASMPIDQCPVPPEHFSDLVNLVSSGEVTDQIGRTVLKEIFHKGGKPKAIIEEKGLKTVQDTDQLDKILYEVFQENPDVMNQILKGDLKPVDFLIGQVMRKTKGTADPKRVRELILSKI
jgi:aspartyl-tRNA(Asn)/glutamyl-tRNA(Gln) amidotransferase subunit B